MSDVPSSSWNGDSKKDDLERSDDTVDDGFDDPAAGYAFGQGESLPAGGPSERSRGQPYYMMRPAAWLAVAAASGIAGNLAYDALKASVRAAVPKGSRRRRKQRELGRIAVEHWIAAQMDERLTVSANLTEIGHYKDDASIEFHFVATTSRGKFLLQAIIPDTTLRQLEGRTIRIRQFHID